MRPYVVVKTTLKDASGAQVWSTRYISASAEAKPFTGDNGWFKDDARPLRLALEQSLKRSIDVMLRDVGRLRQTVYRGLERVDQHFKLTMIASNLTRIARILAAVPRGAVQ
ncbi:transposase, IS4 [Cupriavidus sp. GA3-3]|nr:transposase, IS4 [Cupriavidus sp. GA3-3]